MDNILFQIRATGILIENGRILLVKQHISDSRGWSLPGGHAEAGERLEEAEARELFEETGLRVRVKKLLYVCDKPDCTPPLLHISFLLERIGGELTLPTNEFDKNPIHDVRFAPIEELPRYGFTEKFCSLAAGGFPGAGSYMGLKSNIGL